jgi:hypothetical protein
MAGMEWAIGTFIVVMLGLFVWSNVTAGKTIQPFVDDLLGVSTPEREKKARQPSADPKTD